MNAQLVTESGEVIEDIPDVHNDIIRLIDALPEYESTHFLRYIDAYGDTVFNWLQIAPFLIEWGLIETRAASETEKAITAEVRRLARLCQSGHHEYLKFFGD